MTDQNTINATARLNPEDSNWIEQVIIRPLIKADLPDLEWEGEYTRFRLVYAEVYRRIQKNLSVAWIADLPAFGVIGQVFVQLFTKKQESASRHHRAYVHSFRVRPAYRRAGIGARLMQTVETDLIRRNYQEITLNVSLDNPGALRLYQRIGYETIGKDSGRWSYFDERNILQQVNEPGWQMRKKLYS